MVDSIDKLISGEGFKIEKDLFNDVILTDQEKEQALYEARKAKHLRLFKEDYAKRVMREVKYLKLDAVGSRAWALKCFRDKNNGKEFILDEFSEPILTILSAYFGKDGFFTSLSNEFSFSKGIALIGNIGVGKTELMKMFQQNTSQSYLMISCTSISRDYSNWDSKVDLMCPIDTYYAPHKMTMQRQFNHFGQELFGHCFDDLGTEEIPAKNYGRDINVMAEIFLRRYSKKETIPFNMTHFTTNCTTDQLLEKYGTRVYDRMKEMFNIIQFDGHAASRR